MSKPAMNPEEFLISMLLKYGEELELGDTFTEELGNIKMVVRENNQVSDELMWLMIQEKYKETSEPIEAYWAELPKYNLHDEDDDETFVIDKVPDYLSTLLK